MKIKNYVNYIFSIFLCCIILNYAIVASEGPVEAEAQKTSESITEAQNTQKEANERIEQAKEKQAAATTDQEKTEAELQEEAAKGDLYSAQIQEQTGLLDLANQQGNKGAAEQATEAIKVAESNQATTEKKITELNQQLTQEFVSTQEKIFAISDIVFESGLVDYVQKLQAGTFDDNLSQKIGYLKDVRTKVQNMFLDRIIEDGLTAKKTTGEKLEFLNDKRMIFNNLLDIYRDELNDLDAWSKSNKVTDVDKYNEYKTSLKNAINDISQKKVMLDMHSASLELQNVSLFSRIVSAVKDWFENTFGSSKTPWYKRSVDYEISKLSDIKQQIDKFKETNVVNFADQVADINYDIAKLETQFEKWKDVLDLDNFEKNIAARENQLNDFSPSDIQNARGAVDAFNTLYENSLQPMQGDILAMSRRYLDPTSPFATLFDDLAAYYASDSIFEGLSYRPEQAYQALFTPDVIDSLNKKNPGLNLTAAMFDPLTFNSDIISPQLIDQAYTESIAIYKMGTTAWQAARNAGFLLGNPVSKETYDAFLKDYKTLLSKGVKDPYKGRSPFDNVFLNNQGALSQLQLTEAAKNKIIPLLEDLMKTIQTKSDFDSAGTALNTTLDAIKQKMQTLRKNISDFKTSQQQQILGDIN